VSTEIRVGWGGDGGRAVYIVSLVPFEPHFMHSPDARKPRFGHISLLQPTCPQFVHLRR